MRFQFVTASQILTFSSLISAPACGGDGRAVETETSAGGSSMITTGEVATTTGDPTTTASSPEEEHVHAALPASILVRVEDEDGAPIVGAKIVSHHIVVSPEPSPGPPDVPRSQGQQAWLTNSEGLALLEGLQGGILSFEVRQHGYSSAVGQVTLDFDSALQRTVRLQRTKSINFLAEQGLVGLEPYRGATVEVSPHGLVYAGGQREEPNPGHSGQTVVRPLAGQPVEGEVEAELAVVHPYSADPTAIPAPLLGASPDGTSGGMLISGGMIEFRMSQDGIPVQPAPGGNVKLSLRVEAADVDPRIREAVDEGKAIPKWYFDIEQGRWISEGVWIPEPGPDNSVVLTALQSHFTWINVDISGNPYCHRIQLVDLNGDPIVGEKIQVLGPPSHQGLSGPDGMACLEAPSVIHVQACGKIIKLAPKNGQTVSACSGGVDNAALNGAFGLPKFPGPYDDNNCPVEVVECDQGEAICNPGDWVYCDPNDLDKEVGICQNSKRYCIDGYKWSECASKVEPKQFEVCEDEPGLDDDCDGSVEEGCGCTEGDEQFCYPGNLGQLQHAPCAVGKQVCQQGGVWGDCIGATEPEAEKCDTPVDESCDGKVDCSGGAAWAQSAHQESADLRGVALAVAPQDAFVVAGINVATANQQTPLELCGGAPLNDIDPLDDDGLVVKFASNGDCAKARRIGGPGEVTISDVAVDGDNQIYVVGHYSGTIEMDDKDVQCGVELPGQGQPHMFLAKYDSDLTCLWRRPITKGAGKVTNPRIALAPEKRAFVVAEYQGLVELVKADNLLVPNAAVTDGLVMEILIAGVVPVEEGKVENYQVIDATPAAGARIPTDIALHGESLAVSGSFTERLGIEPTTEIGSDWFVRRYTLSNGHLADGEPEDLFGRIKGNQRATSLAFASGGELVVAGFSDFRSVNIRHCGPLDEQTGPYGFIAYDLKNEVGQKDIEMSAACVRLDAEGDASVENVYDFAIIEDPDPNSTLIDVVAIGNVVNPVPGQVQVRAQFEHFFQGTPCGDADLFTLDAAQGADALAFRVSFGKNDCKWLKRMPQALAGIKPLTVTDDGSDQIGLRLAAGSNGAVFMTGHYNSGIGFAADDSPPFNLAGGPQDRAFVAKINP